jgi:hypothetical protein
MKRHKGWVGGRKEIQKETMFKVKEKFRKGRI